MYQVDNEQNLATLNETLFKLSMDDISYIAKINILQKIIGLHPDTFESNVKIYTVDKIYFQGSHEYKGVNFDNYIVLLKEYPNVPYKMFRRSTGELEIFENSTITCDIVDGKLIKVNVLQPIITS